MNIQQISGKAVDFLGSVDEYLQQEKDPQKLNQISTFLRNWITAVERQRKEIFTNREKDKTVN